VWAIPYSLTWAGSGREEASPSDTMAWGRREAVEEGLYEEILDGRRSGDAEAWGEEA
jgi:hypothetical protein